jgi:hypothetical protein
MCLPSLDVTSQPSLVLFLSSLMIKTSMGHTTMATSTHHKAIIGTRISSSFWLYDSQPSFDLTPSHFQPSAPPALASLSRIITSPITASLTKSALIIIDVQNFFVSPQWSRPIDSKGLKAQQLLKYAIPAAHKAGISYHPAQLGLDRERDRRNASCNASHIWIRDRCEGFTGVRRCGESAGSQLTTTA